MIHGLDLGHGVFATVLGVVGVALSVLGFLAARSPEAARIAATSDGVASLLTGLSFTAIACGVVLHHGRRSAQLNGAYDELHRVTLQRERSEAALCESERFTRATLDAVDAQIAVLDTDGVIMAVNRTWRSGPHALLGPAGSCDVGSDYLDLCASTTGPHAVEAGRVAAAIGEIVSGEGEDRLLESRVHPGGRRIVTRITRFAGRGPVRLVVAHQDVTDLAPAAPEIEAARDAAGSGPTDEAPAVLARRTVDVEKASRELEALTSSVAHDLQPSLRAIDALARSLGGQHAAGLETDAQRCLAGLCENAAHVAERVDALLALSRLGRRSLDRSPVDMTALARTVVEEVGRRHPAREVLVAVEGLAPAVGDVTLLRQLFANLIGNAFKYTSQVVHPCIDIGSVDAEDGPVYYVRDNGAGFDMRHAEELFHAPGPANGSNGANGTGIGLAVVQRVVDRHGGRVWAEGRVGDGATFFFTLGGEPPAVA